MVGKHVPDHTELERSLLKATCFEGSMCYKAARNKSSELDFGSGLIALAREEIPTRMYSN